MPKKPTAADAQLILQLYDLRREPELRKARNWWLVEFWPDTVEDYMKHGNTLGTQENNWLRQVGGYWGLASSLVLNGALNETLFFDPSFSGEMFFLFAKVQPFLKELREKSQNPTMFANIEKVIMSTKASRERFAQVSKFVAGRRKAMLEAAKKMN